MSYVQLTVNNHDCQHQLHWCAIYAIIIIYKHHGFHLSNWQWNAEKKYVESWSHNCQRVVFSPYISRWARLTRPRAQHFDRNFHWYSHLTWEKCTFWKIYCSRCIVISCWLGWKTELKIRSNKYAVLDLMKIQFYITFLSVLDKLNDCEFTRIIVDWFAGRRSTRPNRFIRSAVDLFQLSG